MTIQERSTSLRCLLSAQLVAALLSPALFAEEDANEGVWAPGPQTPQVVAFLERIRDGYLQSEKRLENIRVRGQVSQVHMAWLPGIEEPAPEDLPEPRWYDFELVHRDGKRRYEQQYDAGDGTSNLQVRLTDGSVLYALDDKTLQISPVKDLEVAWSDLDRSVSLLEQVFEGRKYVPLVEACNSLIRQLKGDATHSEWDADFQRLHCVECDGLLCVEKLEGPSVPEERSGYTFSFAVDPSRGYRVVHMERRAGGRGRGLDYHEVKRMRISEIGPGLFFPASGTVFVGSAGTVAQRDGDAGWGRKDLVVKSVEVGDFEYDTDLFDWTSLPIPDGTYVEDRRVDPPLTYRFR
jgi:hypothetical protein